jgi:hypothetical protein
MKEHAMRCRPSGAGASRLVAAAWASLLIGLASAGCQGKVATASPLCPEGQVLRGNRCGPAAGDDCDVVEDRGGCPAGWVCEPGTGCVSDGSLEECGEDGACEGDRACQDGLCVDPAADADHDGVPAAADCNDLEAVVGRCGDLEDCVDGRCGVVGQDGDGDGVPFPDDCDDLDPDVHPGAGEACNGVDDDCSGAPDDADCRDDDGDGFFFCEEARNPFLCDCDDADAEVNPGRAEVCDGAAPEGGADCDPLTDGCGAGAACCAGACADTRFGEADCGGCGQACAAGQFCANGECMSEAGGVEQAPDEGRAVSPSGSAQNAPVIAFNRQTLWSWYGGPWSFWWHFFEYAYGIAWVENAGGHGVVSFSARHFGVCPLDWRGFFDPAMFAFPCVRRRGCLSPSCGFGFGGDFYPTLPVAVLQAESSTVALAPGGLLGFGLSWTDDIVGRSQVFFGNAQAYGLPGGPPVPVTDGWSSAERPSLAWTPWFFLFGEGFGLVYEDDSSGAKQIAFRRVDSFFGAWQPFGAAAQLSADPRAASAASIAWTPAGFGVVWVGADSAELFYARVSEVGVPFGLPVQVTSGAQAAGTRTGLAWNDDAGELGVAYEGSPEGEGENEEIYFARLTAVGQLLGQPLRVTDLQSVQNAPTVAWSGEDWGVSWSDGRFADDEHPEVVVARISREGDRVLEELRITEHRGGGSADHPALAYGWDDELPVGFLGGELVGRGEYAIAWSDRGADDAPAQILFTRLVRQ